MKKLLYFAFFSFFAFFAGAIADTITINWLNTDNTINQTTTCNIGGDLILPATPTKPGYDFVGWKRLYALLEYIEINGTQFIDTGIIPNTNTKFRVKLNMQAATGNYIIGFINLQSINKMYRFFNYNQQIFFDYANDEDGRISGGAFRNNKTYDFLVGARYVKDFVTDTILIGQEQTMNAVFTDTIKIGYGDAAVHGKIYLLQIWDGETLVRDFIPVLDYNDVPCMYDKVTNQFFYNAGTGDFIAGPVVGGGS